MLSLRTIKVRLPNGTTVSVKAFSSGNNEDYILHWAAIFRLFDQKGLKVDEGWNDKTCIKHQVKSEWRRPLPYKCLPISYGAKAQLTPEADSSEPLDEHRKRRIQEIVGLLLSYARAVDNKLLVALSAITARQAFATIATEQAVHLILDYVATYPADGIVYRSSDMILCAHADAGFLNETNSRSRAGAHIFLAENDPFPRFNGAVLSIAQITKFVMASAAESELAALYGYFTSKFCQISYFSQNFGLNSC